MRNNVYFLLVLVSFFSLYSFLILRIRTLEILKYNLLLAYIKYVLLLFYFRIGIYICWNKKTSIKNIALRWQLQNVPLFSVIFCTLVSIIFFIHAT